MLSVTMTQLTLKQVEVIELGSTKHCKKNSVHTRQGGTLFKGSSLHPAIEARHPDNARGALLAISTISTIVGANLIVVFLSIFVFQVHINCKIDNSHPPGYMLIGSTISQGFPMDFWGKLI